MPGESLTFDLSELSRAKYDGDRGFRMFALLVTLSTAVFAAIGAFLVGEALTSAWSPTRAFGASALLVGPAILSAGFAGLYRIARQGPARLEITQAGLSFLGSPHKRDIKLGWDDPGFSLALYDLSGMARVSQRSGRSRVADYIAVLRRGYRVAMTPPAFEATLSGATARGLSVARDPSAERVPGVRVFRIRRP
jgi:hypothetical protein